MPLLEQTKKKITIRLIVISLFCAIVIVALFLFLKSRPNSSQPSTSQVPSAINIGVHINDSPGFNSLRDGQRNGFDIDLANFIAEGLGRHPNFVPMTIDARDQNLRAKYVDLVVSTYSISDKRIAGGIIFAGPYIRTYQGILVRKDDDSILSTNDLASKTVCVTNGSTSKDKLNELKKSIPLISTDRDTFSQCLEDLKNPSANVAAVTSDAAVLQGHAHADQALKFIPEIIIPGTYEKYGIGLSKDNMELCHQVATLLKEFVNKQWNSSFSANLQVDQALNARELKPDPSNIDTESCRTD